LLGFFDVPLLSAPELTLNQRVQECVGPLPVLQTLWDKEPFSRHGGLQKERVIVSEAGPSALGDNGSRFRRSGFPLPHRHFLTSPQYLHASGHFSVDGTDQLEVRVLSAARGTL
jgi:hypothetical protein